MNRIKSILPILRELLSGEPLRAIGYGAIVTVYLVTHLLVALGYQNTAPELNAIVAAVGNATGAVVDFVSNFAGAFGIRPASGSLDGALLVIGALTVAFTEVSRRYVYSPKTVAAIVAGAPASAANGVANDLTPPPVVDPAAPVDVPAAPPV